MRRSSATRCVLTAHLCRRAIGLALAGLLLLTVAACSSAPGKGALSALTPTETLPTATASATPSPTSTSTPTRTPTATATPPPTATPTPPCGELTLRDAAEPVNVRRGPGTAYGLISQLQADEKILVRFKTADELWVQGDLVGAGGQVSREGVWITAGPEWVTIACGLDGVRVVPAEQIPPTPTPEPTATPATITSGRNFTILNEREDGIRLSIQPAWGREEVESLIDKYKPGWHVTIRVIADRSIMPIRWDGQGGGVGMYFPSCGGFFYSQMAAYDPAQQEATWFVWPGTCFTQRGAEQVKDGDKGADVSTTWGLVDFLYFSDPTYLGPDTDVSQPELQAERNRLMGVPFWGCAKAQALLEWSW